MSKIRGALAMLALATGVTAAGPALSQACNTQGMRSPGTNSPTHFTIINQVHDRSAQLYWIDFDGRPQLYATIPPNGRYEQQTYRGHIWKSENSLGYCDIIFIAENNAEIIIK
ncbi:hypothetical protein [Oricola sp.]|uniref:VHL beta domain-containing protein n=1 Tax=Oricola sp. TaxID=1979950 RepID=UPI0025D2459B|nr:hypothetical protein [Oricola sp.]MCI5074213.1 hypothetical protein [Oricola sp.]